VLLSSKKLVVVPWHDPVVEEVGYDVRSMYVELFWLNVLGPSATWIMRRLTNGSELPNRCRVAWQFVKYFHQYHGTI